MVAYHGGHCGATGLDSTGEVKSGSITLEGQLIPGVLLYNMADMDHTTFTDQFPDQPSFMSHLTVQSYDVAIPTRFPISDHDTDSLGLSDKSFKADYILSKGDNYLPAGSQVWCLRMAIERGGKDHILVLRLKDSENKIYDRIGLTFLANLDKPKFRHLALPNQLPFEFLDNENRKRVELCYVPSDYGEDTMNPWFQGVKPTRVTVV